jgi:hypothetical protein
LSWKSSRNWWSVNWSCSSFEKVISIRMNSNSNSSLCRFSSTKLFHFPSISFNSTCNWLSHFHPPSSWVDSSLS